MVMAFRCGFDKRAGTHFIDAGEPARGFLRPTVFLAVHR